MRTIQALHPADDETMLLSLTRMLEEVARTDHRHATDTDHRILAQ